MNLSKRVIILDRLSSPTIAQAIFILKDNADCEFSAVMEAEKIVNEYMENSKAFTAKRRCLPIILSALAMAGVVLAIIMSL